jgi:CheY-like chemotaxis protein
VAALLRQINDCPPIANLVAEDAPDNRVLVQAYLKSGLYDLTVVEDGQSAVEQFAARTCDLILMDMQMPIMDGLTATRKIRELERERGGRRTPILALTAYARQVDVEMSRDAGCDSHVSKPISKATLVGMIAKYWPKAQFPAPTTNALDLPEPDLPEDEGIDYLVPDYLAARRSEVAEMTELLRAADFDGLGVLAHNLKGSGLSYGFPDLTRRGRELEQFATDSDTDGARDLVEQLGGCLRRIDADSAIGIS